MVTDRSQEITALQQALAKFGCAIKTRLGLHEVNDDRCAPGGLILLELTGDPAEFVKLENELLKIDGLQVRKMVFTPA